MLPAAEARQRLTAECSKAIDGIVTTALVGADRNLIAAPPNLRVIVSRGVGYDRVALATARAGR